MLSENSIKFANKVVYPLPIAAADFSTKPPTSAAQRQLMVNRWHQETILKVAKQFDDFIKENIDNSIN